MDETLQEVRHSRKADICVSHLQDVRTSRCPVHHRSLHKLCNRYIATVRQTTGSLDQKGRGSTVSAGWLSHTLQHTLRTLNCALCPRHFCLTIQKKNYQLFSYWFLLNSCEWSYSINYIVFFYPYISSLKDFLFELLIYVLFESMGLTRNCVCLSYSLGLNHDFEENYISSSIKYLQWGRKMPVIRTVIRNLQF